MKCIKCNTEFEAKKPIAKFCSAKCRVAWNRNNPSKLPKNEIKAWQIQPLVTQLREEIEKLSKIVHDLTHKVEAQNKTVLHGTPKASIPVNDIDDFFIPQGSTKEKELLKKSYIMERLGLKDATEIAQWEKALKSDTQLTEQDKETILNVILN